MSFEAFKQALLAQAQAEAQAAAQEIQTHSQAEQQRILDRAREVEERIIASGEETGQQEARRLHQQAELAGRSAVLRAKEEELTATQEALVKRILADDTGTTELLMLLLHQLPKTGELVPGEVHRQALEKLAKDYVIAKETIANDGGFIFRNDETEINFTVRYLVQQIFRRHRAEIASQLFA